jgi:hypothetical protein
MVTSMPQTMAAWNPPQMPHSMTFADQGLQYSQPHMSYAYLPAPNAMPSAPQMPREPLLPPGQSGPWQNDADSILLDAKGRGMSWEEIHKKFFPNKSANACRKRHERVLAKMRSTDWDEARVQRVTEAYNRHRQVIWAPLCKELNESWSDVEKVVSTMSSTVHVDKNLTLWLSYQVFQQGLRNLRNPSRSSHVRNRSRASSGHAGLSEYERGSSLDEPYDHTDDSGISLGHSRHSRRPSEMGGHGLSTSVESLPSVNHLLGESSYHYTS